MHDELAEVVLSTPEQTPDALRPRRQPYRERELDPLAGARRVLRRQPMLTFAQLSWPGADPSAGGSAEVYDASAQLFVAELLKLNDGPARLRRMLAGLPVCYNWQTAFQNAFADRFPRSVDLEKWWMLEVIAFLAQDSGPAWTPSVSAGRLDELLLVPAETRASTNALPDPVLLSLQTAIQTLTPAEQVAALPPRLRALQIARVRMAPWFQSLAADYVRVLADYLDLASRAGPAAWSVAGKHAARPALRWQADVAIKKLDTLDARRRALEGNLRGNNPPPGN